MNELTAVNDRGIMKHGVKPVGKRQDAAKQTRDAIIRAAEKIHEERGLSNASVDDIVAEAGVSKGSFYVYFKRKEDVASEISFLRFKQLRQSVENQPGTAAEKIGRFLTGSVRCIVNQGLPLCKQWLKGAVSSDCSGDPGVKKLNDDRSFLADTLRAAAERGELREDTPAEFLADLILAEYYGAVTLWSITDGNYPLCERMEQFSGTLGTMLEGYLNQDGG